jgi:hypothetical protein
MALSRIYKQKRNMKNLHIPFLSHYFQNISLFGHSEKRNAHTVLAHYVGGRLSFGQEFFSVEKNSFFNPYCTMF